MSYTFVAITTYYPLYLDDYYRRNPKISDTPYSEQLQHILEEGFGKANYYCKYLSNIGINTHTIIANAKPLQKAWAIEHGFNLRGNALLLKQLRVLKPDVVYWEDSTLPDEEFMKNIKIDVPSIRQNIGFRSVPYSMEQLRLFRSFDYMIACAPGLNSEFKELGLRSYLIYHAFEDSLLNKISATNNYPATNVLFLGSMVLESGFHNQRMKIIEELLANNIDVQFRLQLQNENFFLLLLKQESYSIAKLLKKIGLTRLANQLPGINKALMWHERPEKAMYPKSLTKKTLPPLFGVEMLKALRMAKIGFNIHIDKAIKDAGNMRIFEVTGVGACLVTDWKENIGELFEPGKEIITFQSVEECVENIKWLIDHPVYREEIAKAGQARCLRDHTYAKRAIELNHIICSML